MEILWKSLSQSIVQSISESWQEFEMFVHMAQYKLFYILAFTWYEVVTKNVCLSDNKIHFFILSR